MIFHYYVDTDPQPWILKYLQIKGFRDDYHYFTFREPEISHHASKLAVL